MMRNQHNQMAIFKVLVTGVLLLSLMACAGQPDCPEETASNEQAASPPATTQRSYLALFEIPAKDIDRAIRFYQSVLGIDIEKMEMPGMEMGIFPYENQAVNAVIMKSEGYVPSADGVTIYLNAGEDLQAALDRVEPNGGTILLPKTAHADESGFFALFLDSEGNKMGLNSPN